MRVNNMEVRLYTAPACPFCYALKDFLKEKNIRFEEIDVSKDERAREELIKKTGKMEVPVVEINGQIVVGFDKEKILKLLHLK